MPTNALDRLKRATELLIKFDDVMLNKLDEFEIKYIKMIEDELIETIKELQKESKIRR